jgi:hypothetical protein
MTRQDSDSDLAGRLGASLTASVPRIITRHRGEESSGLFDLAALQAADLDLLMERAHGAPQPHRVMATPDVARSPAFMVWPERQPATPSMPAMPAIEWIEESPPDLPVDHGVQHHGVQKVRARGVGAFGIAVAWLATTVMGFVIATTMPAHVLARGRLASSSLATITALSANPTPASASTVPVTKALPATSAQGLVEAPPSEAPVLPPSAPWLAKSAAGAGAGRMHRRTHAAPRPVAVQAAGLPPQTRPTAEAPTTAVPATPPTVGEGGAPKATATAPKAAAAPTPPPTAASPTPAGTSLEDLIRREVAAESKRR